MIPMIFVTPWTDNRLFRLSFSFRVFIYFSFWSQLVSFSTFFQNCFSRICFSSSDLCGCATISVSCWGVVSGLLSTYSVVEGCWVLGLSLVVSFLWWSCSLSFLDWIVSMFLMVSFAFVVVLSVVVFLMLVSFPWCIRLLWIAALPIHVSRHVVSCSEMLKNNCESFSNCVCVFFQWWVVSVGIVHWVSMYGLFLSVEFRHVGWVCGVVVLSSLGLFFCFCV